jgi:hypothetical protein
MVITRKDCAEGDSITHFHRIDPTRRPKPDRVNPVEKGYKIRVDLPALRQRE